MSYLRMQTKPTGITRISDIDLKSDPDQGTSVKVRDYMMANLQKAKETQIRTGILEICKSFVELVDEESSAERSRIFQTLYVRCKDAWLEDSFLLGGQSILRPEKMRVF